MVYKNMEDCPIHCVKAGCADPPDFLEKHNAFLLTVIASGSAALGLIFSYFLKSRCRTISIFNGCISCDRTPVELEVIDTQIVNNAA